jgi:ubiquitin-like modifier-activating enzyme ATG7
MVSVLQSKDKLQAAAPLPGTSGDQDPDHPLGIVPHQVRGSLSMFTNNVITGRSYDCCSACSDRVVDKFKADGWEFVKKAMNEKGYVEELSGLAEVSFSAGEAVHHSNWQ